MRNPYGSEPDPHGNDAPSAGKKRRGHEQVISSHHPVGDEVAKVEIEMFTASISWEKKAKPDLRKVHQNSNLPDASTSSPKRHPEPP